MLFIDAQPAAQIELDATRAFNGEPLILGRESWGGDPSQGDTPGYYIGLLDEVKVWTRPLSPEEVQKEFTARPAGQPES